MKKFAAVLASVAFIAGTTVVASGAASAATPGYYGAADYQGDIAHQGYAGAAALPSTLNLKWSKDFGGSVSYPVIISNRMYFTAQDGDNASSTLYAVSATTGATLWGPIELGTRFSAVSWDNGQLFVQLGSGLLEAFSGATGKLNWSVQLPGQYMFTSPPTATAGVVYTAGAGDGGTLYAVSEATGTLEWTQSVENGDHSAPSVDSTGIYVSYAGEFSYKFSTSGQLLWSHNNGIEGGGGRTTVVHNSRLWIRDDAGMTPTILNATTGAPIGTFAGITAPAFYAGTAITTTSTGLQAINATTGQLLWTQPGDGQLASAPYVAGTTVYVGSGTGNIYGYSAITGKLVWEGFADAPVNRPDEHNDFVLQGLQIADGLLAVPASTRMSVFG
jgi:outer membrane protein assembly factor BamB